MSKMLASIALLLFVPACSVGVVMSLFIAPGKIGNGVFAAVKIWVVVLPLFWTARTNPNAIRLPKLNWTEIKVGLSLGILMFSAIAITYLFVGQQIINTADLQAKAREVGLVNPYLYVAGCFYWSFINSLIEECTWRGFVVSQSKVLFPQKIAVILAAIFFTVHHSIALYGYTHNLLVVFIGSLGVLLAGIIWAWCYNFYQSVVPGYISHIFADIAIAIIGYKLLFS